MIFVFADMPAYLIRFGREFNAAVPGEAVMDAAVFNQDCAGILFNRAAGEEGMIITRERLFHQRVDPRKGKIRSRPASAYTWTPSCRSISLNLDASYD